MDILRSRLFWFISVLFILLIISAVFYVDIKNLIGWNTPQSPVTDYNPLKDEGFERATDWDEFRSHGPLSATAADFQKDKECRRVVMFLARGAVLGHILTACDSMEPSMGLLMVDDILYYYGRAMEKQDSAEDDKFVVAKKIIGEHKCLMKSYLVRGLESPTVEETPESREVEAINDNDCSSLINFKMPPMLLLSRSSNTGLFSPSTPSGWATINPWEPLGAVTRLFLYGARCFRLLVITSYGRTVQAVKVSCGPVEGVLLTESALYYGDALMVRRNPDADTFVLVFNPKGSGTCFKKIVSLSNKPPNTLISTISKEHLSEHDKECNDLVMGNIAAATVEMEKVSDLVTKLHGNTLGVEPYGAPLSTLTPYSQWNSFNLRLDLGIAVAYYKQRRGLLIYKMLLVVARGVPIAAALVDPGPVQHLVMRGDVLYHGKSIMLKKTSDSEKFITLIRIDDYNCLRKSYLLKNVEGVTIKEELPSGGNVTKSMDEDCRDLLEGNKLKNQKSEEYGALTDEFGVPMTFLKAEKASEKEPEDKKPE